MEATSWPSLAQAPATTAGGDLLLAAPRGLVRRLLDLTGPHASAACSDDILVSPDTLADPGLCTALYGFALSGPGRVSTQRRLAEG